jgi:hypothetical protein
MDTSISTSRNPSSVRLPFRILAGLILVVSAVAMFGQCFLAWHGQLGPTQLRSIYWIPAELWLVRHAFFAMRFGRAGPSTRWPFASDGVWFAYVLFGLVVISA